MLPPKSSYNSQETHFTWDGKIFCSKKNGAIQWKLCCVVQCHDICWKYRTHQIWTQCTFSISFPYPAIYILYGSWQRGQTIFCLLECNVKTTSKFKWPWIIYEQRNRLYNWSIRRGTMYLATKMKRQARCGIQIYFAIVTEVVGFCCDQFVKHQI